MQVGLFLEPRRYDFDSDDPFHPTIELAQLGESLGFDFVAIGHHSFTPGADAAAPLMMLSAIAARTSKIRLATSILIMPMYHPLTIAEQVATLDRISNGRVILGSGVGYRQYEFDGMGADFQKRGRRFDESLQILREGWRNGYFEFAGEEFTIPHLPVDPQPVQTPHPPMWIGGGSERARRRAAKLGDGWISEIWLPIAEEAKNVEAYRNYCEEAGGGPGNVCIVRNAWTAETREEVERDWLDTAVRFHHEYLNMGANVQDPDGFYEKLRTGEPLELRDFITGRGVAGTPEDCIAQVKDWYAATRSESFLFVFSGDGGQEEQSRAVRLFGENVLPAIKPLVPRDT